MTFDVDLFFFRDTEKKKAGIHLAKGQIHLLDGFR